MKDDRLYLLHVQDACRRIVGYCQVKEAAFLADGMVQDAVIRNFQIIGEAVKMVSPMLKGRTPEIAWREIAGMRDKLVHGYFDVDIAVVWETATRRVPLLLKQVEVLIEQLGGEALEGEDNEPVA